MSFAIRVCLLSIRGLLPFIIIIIFRRGLKLSACLVTASERSLRFDMFGLALMRTVQSLVVLGEVLLFLVKAELAASIPPFPL
jgi:hypothetical protein